MSEEYSISRFEDMQALIAERDAEIERVTANCNALDDQNDQLRAELAALKAQEPVAWPDGGSDAVEGAALGAFDTFGQPEHDLESWTAGYAEAVYAHTKPLYAAPVVSAEQQGVADGWKLVPVEPTEKMLEAGYFTDHAANRGVYQAMLAAAPAPSTTEGQPMKIGDRYNWKNQPERLVYIGMCEPRNGFWHQFAKVESPDVVWCEVQPQDMHMLEETKPATEGQGDE